MYCPNCNSKMTSSKAAHYHYIESGLTNVYLNGVNIWRCPKCDSEEVEIPDPAGLNREIAHILISKENGLTGKEFRFLRTYLGHSGEEIALRFEVARETVSRWETGSLKVPRPADIALRHMVALGEANHNYSVTDLKQILESRRRVRQLEARFRNHWTIKEKTA